MDNLDSLGFFGSIFFFFMLGLPIAVITNPASSLLAVFFRIMIHRVSLKQLRNRTVQGILVIALLEISVFAYLGYQAFGGGMIHIPGVGSEIWLVPLVVFLLPIAFFVGNSITKCKAGELTASQASIRAILSCIANPLFLGGIYFLILMLSANLMA